MQPNVSVLSPPRRPRVLHDPVRHRSVRHGHVTALEHVTSMAWAAIATPTLGDARRMGAALLRRIKKRRCRRMTWRLAVADDQHSVVERGAAHTRENPALVELEAWLVRLDRHRNCMASVGHNDVSVVAGEQADTREKSMKGGLALHEVLECARTRRRDSPGPMLPTASFSAVSLFCCSAWNPATVARRVQLWALQAPAVPLRRVSFAYCRMADTET
eukprot:6405420-Prymnesium_polylepis.1